MWYFSGIFGKCLAEVRILINSDFCVFILKKHIVFWLVSELPVKPNSHMKIYDLEIWTLQFAGSSLYKCRTTNGEIWSVTINTAAAREPTASLSGNIKKLISSENINL